jgi:hypothetical protein
MRATRRAVCFEWRALVINTSNTREEREASLFGDPLARIWRDCLVASCGVASTNRLWSVWWRERRRRTCGVGRQTTALRHWMAPAVVRSATLSMNPSRLTVGGAGSASSSAPAGKGGTNPSDCLATAPASWRRDRRANCGQEPAWPRPTVHASRVEPTAAGPFWCSGARSHAGTIRRASSCRRGSPRPPASGEASRSAE